MLSLAVQKIDKETKPTNMSKQTKGGLQERKKSVNKFTLWGGGGNLEVI